MQTTHSEDTFHVLIAGDDAGQRQAASRALQQSGLPVQWRQATSFAEAWQCLEHHPVDAVLLHFGGGAGVDNSSAAFLRQAKQRGLPTPMILLADGAEEIAADADWIGAGASDLIPASKVSPESLARALQSVRRLHRAQTQVQQADAARQQSDARFRHVANSNIIGILFWEGDGTIADANDAFLAMIDYQRSDVAWGTLHLRTLTPPQYAPLDSEKIAELLQTGVCDPWEKELCRRDGSRVAVLVSASLDCDSGKGLAFLVDITERKRAQDAQQFLAEAGAALSASPHYAQTLPQVAALAAPAFADWCLIDLMEDGQAMRMASAQSALMPPETAELLAPLFSQDSPAAFGPAHVMQTGRAEIYADADAVRALAPHLGLLRSFVCAPLVVRDRVLGAIMFAYGASGRCHSQADLRLAEQIGRRIGLSVDNARYLFDTQARAEREAVVNAIGQTLRASLDAAQILQAATRALGEAMGASRCFWCWVPLAEGGMDVAPQQYAAPDVAPRLQISRFGEAARALLARLAAATAEPWVVSGASRPPISGPVLQETDLQTFIAAPVLMRGEWSGLLVVEQTGDARQWTASEAALVRQVGGLLGPALENARLYEREHRVADMLQAAFLCNVPDQLSDLELATVYRAGLSESQVGGDCYDVFPLPDGRVALVIADVSGKGLGAAVVTATVKFSLRAFAAEVSAPSLALTRLNRMLCNEGSGLGEHFVTLFYAVFDPAGGRLLYASAGHETQLIKRAAGGSASLGSTGPILGIADHLYEQQEERLGRGDALILFTDGLTEARSPQTRELLDIERVSALVERLPHAVGAGALTASLERLALDWAQGRPHDDMALLVARRMPLSAPDPSDSLLEFALPAEANLTASHADAAGLECLFRLSFPSRAGHAADVRQAVAHWMETLGYDRPSRDGFLTAVTEAVTNAVLHGSPGGEADEFSVAAFRADAECLAVEVVDRGPGLSSRDTSPPMPGPDAVHGRGLPLMREFTDRVEYLPTHNGLCVRLHTRRLP